MLDELRRYFFGEPVPSPADAIEHIPQESRDAHHHFMNVAMNVRKVASDIDNDANDLLDSLARDLKRGARHGNV